MLAPADVIVLNSDCVVARGWYEGMRRAAMSDTRVATVSSLTNHGTIVSVPERNRPSPSLPQNWSLDDAAAAVRASSPVLHPSASRGDRPLRLHPPRARWIWSATSTRRSRRATRRRWTSPSAARARACRTCWRTTCSSSTTAAGRSARRPRSSRRQHHRLIQSRYPYWDGWVAEVRGGAGHAARALAVRRAARAARTHDHHRRAHPHGVHDGHPAARPGGDRRRP